MRSVNQYKYNFLLGTDISHVFRFIVTYTCSRGSCGTLSEHSICLSTRIPLSVSVARPPTWPTRAPTPPPLPQLPLPPPRLRLSTALTSAQEAPIRRCCVRARASRRPRRAILLRREHRTRLRHMHRQRKTTRSCSIPRTLFRYSSQPISVI